MRRLIRGSCLQEPMKIGVLGTGRVGQALASGLVRGGHEVRFGSRDPKLAKLPPEARVEPLRAATEWAEAVVLAVPYSAVPATVNAVGPAAFRGKVVVDVTNAAGPSGLAVGFTTSAAENLAKLIPGARVVKAFNTVFARNMSTGKAGDETLTLFVAGDDPGAKKNVMGLGHDLGFEPVDAGPLQSARYLEPMAMQLMAIAFGLKRGPKIGFRLVGESA